MRKKVDLKKTIFQLYEEHPEIIEIMEEIGFKDIGKGGMINTAGRVMTIPKGAKMKRMDMEHIKEVFKKRGYEIIE